MIAPVRCLSCGSIFDLCEGKPVARYSDCTVFITPCCGRTTDDRPRGWGGGVEPVSKDEVFISQVGGRVNPDGSMSFGGPVLAASKPKDEH